MPDDVEAKEAEWGSRMVEVRVRFWTDNIAEGKGMILPKHVWDSGVVRISSNKTHGVVPGNPIPFNGLAEIPAKLEKLLLQQGIHVHLSRKQRRYIVSD